MRPDQISEYSVPSDPRIHPDGSRVAFVVTTADREADRYVRRIWLWDGESARRFTSGRSDASPRWSPDGSRLAFLRKGPDEQDRPQVAILPAGGGEAEVITSFALGVSDLAWSPDGSTIAVVASEWTEEWAELDDDERKRRPRRIDRVPYRGDGAGWLHDRRSHVYLIDPDGAAEPTCLTPGDFDEAQIAWHPDGSTIAFRSARHSTRGFDPASRVWTVPVSGGEASPAVELGVWGWIGYDRRGLLHVEGRPDPWDFPNVHPIQRIESDGSLTDLTGHLDRSLLTYSPAQAPAGPQWLDDGTALALVEDAGRLRIVRLDQDGSVEDVWQDDAVVTGVSPRPDGSAFAFVATRPTDPGELWWWEDGEARPMTRLNEAFRSATLLTAPERLTFSSDGATVEGWVYLPPGEEMVPTLLNIHGGPATQYGYGFFDEFQVYAAAGYGVVALNPRGSSGYGAQHMRAIVGRWGEDLPPDFADILAGVEAVLETFPRLDGDRRGVMGGSYGGLATVRVLALDDGFASAVAERGLYVWPSFAGTSDIGPWFEYAYVRARMPDGWEALWAASPLAYADRLDTPTLIIHSETDFRTPVEQAEQLFAVLLRRGVETELLRFPAGEGHELSRSGKPRHRVERFEAILDWHGRHLSPGAAGGAVAN